MTGELSRDRATKGTALAPSQHLRTQRRNRRWTAPIVLALGASLLLSACDPKQSDTAAVVNETVINEDDVQTVTRQLNSQNQGGQPYTTSDALVGLILVPFVLAEGNRQKKVVPDEQVLQRIGKIASPTAATANFVKMQLVLQQLDPASQNVVGAQLDRSKIVVNPRYGRYIPKRGLVPNCERTASDLCISPNWIKLSTAPAAQ